MNREGEVGRFGVLRRLQGLGSQIGGLSGRCLAGFPGGREA